MNNQLIHALMQYKRNFSYLIVKSSQDNLHYQVLDVAISPIDHKTYIAYQSVSYPPTSSVHFLPLELFCEMQYKDNILIPKFTIVTI